jgi:hypothetical protein
MFAHILLSVGTAGLPFAMSEIRQEQVFRAWQQAQLETRSLVVEFTCQSDSVESKTLNGIFKLRRAPDGAILARCDLDSGPHQIILLLVSHKAYVMKPAQKVALRVNLSGQKIPEFLGAHYNPFMVLLDKQYAKKHFRLQVTNQDQWYTYLSLAPRNAKGPGNFLGILWSRDFCTTGTIALLNKDSDSIPKDMPRALTWTDGLNSCRYDIRKWQRNGPHSPPLSDFQAPEGMPGWEVLDLAELSPPPPKS